MQDLFEVWTLVAPRLSCLDILFLRRVHKAARHPFSRDEQRVVVRLNVNKNGKRRLSALAECSLPLSYKCTKEFMVCYDDHYRRVGRVVTMNSGGIPIPFKGFSNPKTHDLSIYAEYFWGKTGATRRKSLEKYITVDARVLKTSGEVMRLSCCEVGDSGYGHQTVAPYDRRLAFDVHARPARNSTPVCTVGFLVGDGEVCISDVHYKD
jgi:hypothetical protein